MVRTGCWPSRLKAIKELTEFLCRIQILEEKLNEMSYELKSAQESSQKQDVTIQSLKESLKSKQSEVKCYVITDPWEIVHLVCRSLLCQIIKPYPGKRSP